jgi:hypothetical protein
VTTLFVMFIIYFRYLANANVASLMSVYKALAPVLTTVANFGKIQEVVEKCALIFSPGAHVLRK